MPYSPKLKPDLVKKLFQLRTTFATDYATEKIL